MGSTAQDLGGKRGRRKFRRSGESIEPADWVSANSILLREAIRCVASDGGALRFGYSRDGGAYAIGFYGDGDSYTEYVRPGDDLNHFLLEIIDAYDGNTGIDTSMPIEAP